MTVKLLTMYILLIGKIFGAFGLRFTGYYPFFTATECQEAC